MKQPCECEHVEHFDPIAAVEGFHTYGHECSDIVAVKTDYGWFKVCRKCAETHLKDFTLGIEEEV